MNVDNNIGCWRKEKKIKQVILKQSYNTTNDDCIYHKKLHYMMAGKQCLRP